MVTPAGRAIINWLYRSPVCGRLGHSAFGTMIDLQFYALARAEEEYLSTVDRVRSAAGLEQRPLRAWLEEVSKHLGSLLMEMVDPQDLLGPVYQEISANNKHLGQFFTPDAVSGAMAEMTLHDLTWDQFEKEGGLKILEPASGAGGMLIQAVRSIYKKFGQKGLNRTALTAVDKDELCFKMTYVQLAVLPWPVASIEVIHGDTLTREHWCVAKRGRGVPCYARKLRVPGDQDGVS